MQIRLLSLLLVLGCAGAASRTPTPTVAVAGALAPCAMSAPYAGATWERVAVEQFSFCVPGTMRRSSASRWRGEGSIEWGIGSAPAVMLNPHERGERLARAPLPAISPLDTIDGRPAKVWQFVSGGRYYSGVSFEDPRLFIVGEAGNARVLGLHRALYRTVRFR